MDKKEVLVAIGRMYMQKTAEYHAEVEKIVEAAGRGMEKDAFVLGSLVGAIRGSGLREADRALLAKKYNISPDANMTARNIGRGIVGEWGGAAGGFAGGAAVGAALSPDDILAQALMVPTFGSLGSLVGAIGGMKTMTDKYSLDAVQKILSENARKKAIKEIETTKAIENLAKTDPAAVV